MTPLVLASRAGVCTGPGPCDASPLGEGKNWVTHTEPVEGLGAYVHAIAHALQRDHGMSESQSIATAIATVKHWAGGGGKVTEATRERARLAVAHWEKMKAEAHTGGRADADQSNAAYRLGSAHRLAGIGPLPLQVVKGELPGMGGGDYAQYLLGHNGDRDPNALDDRFTIEPDPGVTGEAQVEGHRSVDQDNAAYREGISDQQAGKKKLTAKGFAATHPGADEDDYPLYEAGYEADRTDLHLELDADEDKESHRNITLDEAKDAARRIRSARNALLEVMGTHLPNPAGTRQAEPAAAALASEARDEQDDISGVEVPFVVGARDMGGGVAEWGAGGPPNLDASGAGNLLPVGPSKKQAKKIDDFIEHSHDPHKFKGKDTLHCSADGCGQPILAPVHQLTVIGPGVRSAEISADSDEISAPELNTEHIEGPLTEELQRYFADQRAATISRLTGKRGKQMLKAAGYRAPAPPVTPPPPAQPAQLSTHATTIGTPPPVPPATGTVLQSAMGAVGSAITAGALAAGTVTVTALAAAVGVADAAVATALGFGSVAALAAALAAGSITLGAVVAAFPDAVPATPDATAIFDKAVWGHRLTGILRPYYLLAAHQGGENVRRQVELPASVDDLASREAAQEAIANRGNQTSPQINDTTYRAIVSQLQKAVANGEDIDQMAKRVNDVFDQADMVRARRIAQTETMSALNSAATAYARALPDDQKGLKKWMAHDDEKTRLHHREAGNGDAIPVDAPYYVGGHPMQHPGDPSAPPDETVNCRCSQVFLPPGTPPNAFAGSVEARAVTSISVSRPVSDYDGAGA